MKVLFEHQALCFANGRQLTARFAILSFPVGKIFHRGRFVGDFMGGSEAHEIVAEMLTIRDDLQLAEV